MIIFTHCIGPLGVKPQRKNLQQRLDGFPRENLPLKKPAVIYWDDHLIPFIAAETDSDCAFLLGMAHAHLRLGQMTLLRRITQGRLAESAGPLAVAIDHSIRILDLDRAVGEIADLLPHETRAWLSGYVAGLNYYQQHLTEKPVEWRLMAIEPEPWRIEDILTIGRLMGADVNWFSLFNWLPLQQKSYFEELWQRFAAVGGNSLPTMNAAASSRGALLFQGIRSGSNALAVSAAKSADGSAMMASDPHLGLQLPNLWIIAGFSSPSHHVVGLMFPGVPMVLVGRNQKIAWAATNMRAASSDIYRLAADDSSQQKRQEKISVRWWRDKKIEIRTSPLGPILSDSPLLKGNHDHVLALKWLGHQASDEFSAFLEIHRAGNRHDFRSAFASYGVSGQNYLYADADGHIGIISAARIPIRSPQYRAKLFQTAEDEDSQWLGIRYSQELPYRFDPEEGFLASANNRPAMTGPPVGYFFSADDRIERLQRLLRQKKHVSLDDLKTMQQDVYVPSAVALRDSLIDRIHSEEIDVNPQDKTRDLFDVLRSWDGYYRSDRTGPVAMQLLLFHLIEHYYGKKYDAQAAALIRSSDHAYTIVMEDLMRDRSPDMRIALAVAVTKAAAELSKFSNWGEMHRLRLAHPFANIPIIGGRFLFDDRPAEGSYNSLMKTAHEITNERHATFYGANARFLCRLKDQDDNFFVLLGGQDGWVGSAQFIDQAALWQKGDYIRVPMSKEGVQNGFRHRMELRPR